MSLFFRHAYKIILLFSCISAFAAQPLFAQVETSSQGQASPSLSAPSGEKLVTLIEIKGNKSISTNTIVSKMKTKIGSPYLENIINDDLKRLYLLGYFSDIKIDTEPDKEGLKVIVSVVERPIIEKITFFGMRKLNIRDVKLKESLKSKETQYLDYPTADEDAKIIKKMYEQKGYSQAEVTYQVELNKQANKAKVSFHLREGKRTSIKEIFVEGNTAFPDKRILKLMKTKRGWLFNAGVLKEEVFKEDIERIRSFYHRQGYVDVDVSHELKADPKKPFLYLSVLINEGKKYIVESVSIKGNKDIAEKDILARVKVCTSGKVFSNEGMKEDVKEMQGLYFDRGYISVQIQEATALNQKTGNIDIVYSIIENSIAYVDKIRIRGNIKTKDLVIRRELRIKPGDKFDGDKLRRSKERLQNLGFFEEISYDSQDTAVPNQKDLIVDVKETKTGSFSVGGGYSTVDQFLGFAEIEQKNFDWKNFPYFTGAGQDLKFRFSAGSLSNAFNLSFTEPWVFDYPVSFGFDAYKETHDREADVGYAYDSDVTGGDLRLGKEISEYMRANMKYRFDNIKISNVDPAASQGLKDEEGSNNISSLETGLSFDNRDNVFDTRKGELLSGAFEVAGGPFGGDKDFTKFFGRASHFVPLFSAAALEFRARLGIANPYGDSEKIPIYDRFFSGGAYTVRGYDERSIGPLDPQSKEPIGGESLFVGNVEYSYPLLNFIKLAVFYDAGNVWEKAGDVFSGGIKSSFGLGFRLKTPIGPIMLDYGIPLNKEPGEEDRGNGKFHFSMSHGF